MVRRILSRARRRTALVAALGVALVTFVAPLALHAQATTPAQIFSPVLVRHVSAARTPATLPVVAVLADAGGTELTDFMIPRATLTESGVAQVVTVAPHLGAIRLRPGRITIEPDLTLAAFDTAHPAGADYVIVPALVDQRNPAIAAWLRAQAARGATIVAICDGAWTVANAGLLAGRRATGHWSSLGGLGKKYPGTTWVRDRRYVVDDRVITTTGVSASLPAAIMLVERIGGRAAAEATARRIGVASWSDAHRTDDYAVSKWMYVKGAANYVAWWRHDSVAVPVADGVDEIALALTVDAIPRTIRGRPFTWSADGRAVTGRQGLRLSVDRARSGVPRNGREIRLPSSSAPPASALDSAIATLGTWYGPGPARLVVMSMEYPGPDRR
jgi:putative intracellular protease/amidase